MDIPRVDNTSRAEVRNFEQLAEQTQSLLRNRSRLLLGTACVVSMGLFWLAGRWFGIPRHPDFEASLMLQPKPAAAMLLAGFTLWVCVALATAITARVRLDAGLCAACIGMAALSGRGGPMRYVFQEASGRNVMLALALELVVLYAFLGLAWFGLWTLHRRGRLDSDALRDGLIDQNHALGERFVAAAAQLAAMALLMLLLAREDDKKQVLASVFVSSFLATLLAYAFAPVRPSAWYWVGPLVVGLTGYSAAYLNWGRGGTSLWKAGFAAGFLAPLARPLPLDYASLGPAGAILGYWVSRRWQRAKELEAADAATHA